jgi:hypothetical protein
MTKKLPTETSVQYQRRRYKEAGLVQINVWVPADDKTRVLSNCYRLRKTFLRNTDVRP